MRHGVGDFSKIFHENGIPDTFRRDEYDGNDGFDEIVNVHVYHWNGQRS
jgi:hypothetical protein